MNTEELKEIQARILAGESFTAEEYRQIIESVRAGRRTAAETTAKTRAPKAKADFDLSAEINDLLGEK